MNPNIAKNIAQTTNNVGHNLLDKIDKVTDSGRELVDKGSHATQDFVGKGIENINKVQEKTKNQYQKITTGVTQQIKEKPLKSALVVAGVSAVLTLLLTRNRKPKYQRD